MSSNYIIKVKTSDRFGAGTDANVCLQLIGEHGHSDVFQLKKSNNPNKFERDQSDEFKFVNVIPIGVLDQLKVWHDNTGLMAAWHLEFIEVSDTSLGKTFRFPCHKWIGGEDSCEAVLRCTEATDGPKCVEQLAVGVPNPNPVRKLSLTEQVKLAVTRNESY